MQTDLREKISDPSFISIQKQTLLSHIAKQAKIMQMPCYLVGGSVRDLLLGKPVHDLDIIVEGSAIQLGDALVREYGGKLTAHPKFGTAVWFLPEQFGESQTLDLITARDEFYEQPGALPTTTPSTIEDDVLRRDFTINALVMRLDGEYFGEFIDLLDGQADLADGTIRVLHPRSFLDDPTRIFRAVRYEQRYGFRIEENTRALINRQSLDVLSKLSGERIRHEFDLIFAEPNAAAMLTRLQELDVFKVFNLPEFNQKYASVLDETPPAEFDLFFSRSLLAYCLWFLDVPKDAIHVLSKRFDFTLEISANAIGASKLRKDLPALENSKPSVWTFSLEKFPPFAVYVLWLATNESALREFLVKWRVVKPFTTGDDLKQRGVSAGPRYKEILTHLRAAWLDGEIQSFEEESELLSTLL